MNKENWVSLFKEIGLTEDQMKNWHRIFEKRYPKEHIEFLKWLRIEEIEIERIRKL